MTERELPRYEEMKCPRCGKFLDGYGACTLQCAYGWHTTGEGFRVHPMDAVKIGAYRKQDGTEIECHEMKPKARRKHPVQLW